MLALEAGSRVEAASAAPTPRPLRRPNIILILADDLGYGDLGCYGQKRIRTPHLDALAAEGTRFTACYAGSPVSVPSRASLLTGRHTGHARIRAESSPPLQRDDTTLAEVLWRYGYRTAALGVWGLGGENTSGLPNKKGFDEWLGYLGAGPEQDYYYPEFLWRNEKRLLLKENLEGAKGTYAPDLFTRAATNFIKSNRDTPFFLYLSYPIPRANVAKGTAGMEVPSSRPYTKEEWPGPEKSKAAMITRLDSDIGEILGFLSNLKLDRQTVVFFSSDNGPHAEGGVDPGFFGSTGPFRGRKGDLYEGGLRVPMVVRWPGIIPAGRVSDFPWALWDLLYTVAELAAVTRPDGLDSLSVAPTLLGKEQKPHEFLYWELHEKGFQQAVRMGDWKALRLRPGEPLALYHLPTDPGETTDIATANPQVIAAIEDYLKSARTDSF
jgi:arylsulfatase A-like enzyme